MNKYFYVILLYVPSVLSFYHKMSCIYVPDETFHYESLEHDQCKKIGSALHKIWLLLDLIDATQIHMSDIDEPLVCAYKDATLVHTLLTNDACTKAMLQAHPQTRNDFLYLLKSLVGHLAIHHYQELKSVLEENLKILSNLSELTNLSVASSLADEKLGIITCLSNF